jgi:hypothetical protein
MTALLIDDPLVEGMCQVLRELMRPHDEARVGGYSVRVVEVGDE